jgi:acyl-homoserine lactone acylase PvdQ
VDAETYEGAIYGLGFVHAKDRLWQLHFLRMLTQGRISEVRLIKRILSYSLEVQTQLK